MTYREAILTTVRWRDGITGVNLCLNVMGMINPVRFSLGNYIRELQQLVCEDEVTELSVTFASGKTGRVYFPKGTVIGELQASRRESQNVADQCHDAQGISAK